MAVDTPQPSHTEDAGALVAPLMRGWLHLACFFISLPAGAFLVASAAPGKPQVGAAVYAVGLAALFGVSGTYHRRRWSARWRARLKRADHGTIFVMIASTYTPLCLIVLGGIARTLMLASVWTAALVGVVLAGLGIAERRLVGGICYLVLGWAAVAVGPAVAHRLTGTQLGLIIAGGVVYTLGVAGLGLNRPNPFPRVFGYHEVWHVMVVAAAVCHYIAIRSLVSA